MIVASPKSITELKSIIDGHKKVLFAGCGTCVTVCLAGGEREVSISSYAVRMARKLDRNPVEISQITIERQCENEFLKDLAEPAAKVEAIVSFGCGAGVQAIAERFPDKPVYAGTQHAIPGRSGRAGGLDGKVPGLRRLHAGAFRRHLSGDAMRQTAAERALRRLDWKAGAKWIPGGPAPGSSSMTGSNASASWSVSRKSSRPKTGARRGTAAPAKSCAKSTRCK